jgi:hypothetical protein
MAGGGGPGGPNPTVNLAFGIAESIVGIAWSGLILYGGMEMNKLRSFGLAMTASIVAMIPCSVCCLLGLPFGIWAVVVINKPEVRAAFR